MQPDVLASLACNKLLTYGFSPVYGAELECYVSVVDKTVERINEFFAPILEAARAHSLPLLRIEKERGEGQFELVFGLFLSAQACVDAVNRLKLLMHERASLLNVPLTFAAKPFADAPGSGLQFHLHLEHNGENAFHKTDDYISDALHYALGGLCAITPHVMPILCPTHEGFSRFLDKDHVPTTVSWGSNNRSCAVRIPYTPAWEHKRIEWRVPAADADPAKVLSLMLHAVACGIDARMEPPAQIYGIASKEEGAFHLPIDSESAIASMAFLPSEFAPLNAEILQSWIVSE